MYDREFHKSIENEETPQAVRLADYFEKYLNPSCFLDFGCSSGIYLDQVKKRLPNITSRGLSFQINQ